MNILVVDDEPIQVNSLKTGLRSMGYKVLEALSAEEALAYLKNDHNKVDLVVTDYAMPGMDGLELLRKIRAHNMNVPVIMVTGYGNKDLVINALNNRCDGFIEKPFTLDELIHEIERVILYKLQNTDSHQLAVLISKVVHQINNPLMAISGSAELTMDQSDDIETIKSCMLRIFQAINKIQRLNKELLQLGRTTVGKREQVDLKEKLNDCLNMFKDLLAIKGIAIEKDLDSCRFLAWGDMFGFEQVFNNLILNAIDAMDNRPEKNLKIRAKMDKASSSAVITIEDTGCGIPEASIEKIFTPYFTSKPYGTGLGLAVVKSVLENHSGRVQVESQVGNGTTFIVTLPAANRD